MTEQNINTNQVPQPQQGEDEIDLIEYAKKIWKGKKTIIYVTGIAFVLGVFIALLSPKQYSVSTVLVPQLGSTGGGSSLKDLASLAVFNLGSTSQSSELTPIVYPQIVNSIPFQLELMHAPIHFEKVDTAVSLYEYITVYQRPSVIGTIKKYTIGLPGIILGALRPEKEELVVPEGVGPTLICLTEDEDKIRKAMEEMVTLNVNSKEGYLTLTANLSEPVATAEFAQKAQELLQREIIKFKIEKSQADLEFIQARYDEVKHEAEHYQEIVAANNDRAKSTVSTLSQVEMTRIQNKYSIANSVYTELAKQLEQAKLQVKKDTPVFTILKPVTIPLEKSKPQKAKIVVIWTFLGAIIGVGIILGKDFLASIKQKWNAEE